MQIVHVACVSSIKYRTFSNRVLKFVSLDWSISLISWRTHRRYVKEICLRRSHQQNWNLHLWLKFQWCCQVNAPGWNLRACNISDDSILTHCVGRRHNKSISKLRNFSPKNLRWAGIIKLWSTLASSWQKCYHVVLFMSTSPLPNKFSTTQYLCWHSLAA